eukprot:TRINITY_DN1235_c4_g1_i1.p1 TRINITY_DN1235_c4_g1~~TRINITY_DN1235_c4_g1_i1.p1  ORF type:complete len:244 (+),score=106.97 TRINITY_DN1235_c4_g1_i1:92-823(+)
MSFFNTGYNNKARTRGGHGDFTWDSLKGDKKAAAQEFYLGRSQMCENIWYGKEGGGKRKFDENELADVKQQEEDMMRQALGLKPMKRRCVEMSEQEQQEALKREGGDDEDAMAQGLGLNKAATKASVQYMQNHGVTDDKLLQGDVVEDKYAAQPEETVEEAGRVVAFETEDNAPEDGFNFNAAQELLKRRRLEKELKKLKKDKKEKKKKDKKRKKDKKKKKSKKKRSRRDSSSDSSSSDSSSS